MNDYFSEHELFQSLLKTTTIKLFWKDRERRFVGASQSFLDYYGFHSPEDIIGKTDEAMGWHIDPDPFMNDEWQVIHTGEPVYDSEGTCIIKGQVRRILATKLPIRRENGEISGLVGYFRDVTEDRKNTELLKYRANNDPLTGLANRNGLMDAVRAYISGYEKKHTDFALLFLDVDDFKTINDTYGHDFGDKCLQAIAKELLDIAGSNSVIARFGGDEFVILRQIPSRDSHSALSNAILSMIQHIYLSQQEARLIEEHFLRLGVSIGWCAYSETEDFEEALKLADSRMYEEKEL